MVSYKEASQPTTFHALIRVELLLKQVALRRGPPQHISLLLFFQLLFLLCFLVADRAQELQEFGVVEIGADLGGFGSEGVKGLVGVGQIACAE